MSTVTHKKPSQSYPEWAKLPKNYDFGTRGVDWTRYHKYFRLRTDAVWEKSKLRDVFRSYHKFFNFDRENACYVWAEPESIVNEMFEKCKTLSIYINVGLM